MKRGAEKQLAKDDVDRDDDEIEEVSGEGFRKASETVLASRPMRGLPKRSLSTISATTSQNTTPEPEASPTPAPKFGGFSGFGTPSSNNAFAFATPPAGASPFNITAPQPSLFNPPPSTQTVAPTASNTAKTFASFIGQPSSKPEPAPPQTSKPTAPLSTEAPEVDDPDLFKYYTSLRGLNVSFLDSLSKATEQDPFADITNLLDRYKSLRLDIQKEYDEKSKKPSEPEKLSKAATPKPAFMPAPPANFAGFGQPSTSTSTSSTTNGGGFQPNPTPVSSTSCSSFSFTPNPAPAPTSFALPSPSAAQSSTSANPFVIAPSSASSSPSGGPTSNTSSLLGTTDKSSSSSSFSFGTSSAPDTSTEKAFPSTTSFTFGTSSASSTAKFPFGTVGKSTSAPAPFSFATPPASSTGASAFGNVASSSTTNVFGSAKPAFPSSSSPVKPGTFGGFGGFGKPAGGSIGNPVGFGFGSPPKTPDAEAIAAGDTFSSDEANKKEDAESSERGQDEQAKTDGEGTFGLTVKNLHDEEGEGEEHEETVHAVKVKAYRFRKSDEKEGSPYLELGVGVLRLKKHKATEARRVLLRNSNTGKININFNLYAGLKPTQNKKALTFIGHDEARASQTYTVRLQSEEQANLLKVAFEREIAFMTPKSED